MMTMTVHWDHFFNNDRHAYGDFMRAPNRQVYDSQVLSLSLAFHQCRAEDVIITPTLEMRKIRVGK